MSCVIREENDDKEPKHPRMLLCWSKMDKHAVKYPKCKQRTSPGNRQRKEDHKDWLIKCMALFQKLQTDDTFILEANR